MPRVAQNRSTAAATVEAAYNIDLTTGEWLRTLALATHRAFDFGLGTQAVLYAKVGGRFSAVAQSLLNSPNGFDRYVAELANKTPVLGQEQVAGLPPGVYAYSQTNAGRDAPDVFSRSADDNSPRGISDWGALVSSTGSAFVVLGGLSQRLIDLRDANTNLWQGIARHIGAGLGLRSAISNGALHAEAIVSSDGHVEHAVGPCSEERGLRDRLRQAVKQREKARRLRTTADDFISLWPGLLDGRLILVDRFDTDGRRYVIAVQAPGICAGPHELTAREREVVACAMDGCTNREIAKKIGISSSTVSTHLSKALLKLNLTRRESLPIEGWASESYVERVRVGCGLSVIFESKPITPSPLTDLTASENAVTRDVFRGLSNVEIARARGRSERTIANQIAEVFWKLNVRSRTHLVKHVIQRWSTAASLR